MILEGLETNRLGSTRDKPRLWILHGMPSALPRWLRENSMQGKASYHTRSARIVRKQQKRLCAHSPVSVSSHT